MRFLRNDEVYVQFCTVAEIPWSQLVPFSLSRPDALQITQVELKFSYDFMKTKFETESRTKTKMQLGFKMKTKTLLKKRSIYQ